MHSSKPRIINEFTIAQTACCTNNFITNLINNSTAQFSMSMLNYIESVIKLTVTVRPGCGVSKGKYQSIRYTCYQKFITGLLSIEWFHKLIYLLSLRTPHAYYCVRELKSDPWWKNKETDPALLLVKSAFKWHMAFLYQIWYIFIISCIKYTIHIRYCGCIVI